MGIRAFKPTTPGRRFYSVPTFEEVTATRPEPSLTVALKKTGGRNNHGHITSRHRGGGHKRFYRIIDFKREKEGVLAKVATIEYDPNRSARIALLHYVDGEKRYILAPEGLKAGDKVLAAATADITPGNTLPLKNIPPGIPIHNIELKKGKGGQIVRSAGVSAVIMAKEGNYAQVRLPSGEVRLVHVDCKATIGVVGNAEHANIRVGKAGRSRWLGRRPRVRGVAMNPVDHPMGGGQAKTSGGRHPCSPWGQPAKGYKTRSKRNPTSKYIVRRRK